MSIQRGFERIADNDENKKMWWWLFGRTGVKNNGDQAAGKSQFNRSVITTQFHHHPFRYGLTNVLFPDPKKVDAYKSAAAWEKFMCGFSIVLFESGVHDLASPDRHVHRAMQAACTKPIPCTDDDLRPLLHNESWRLDMLTSYRRHLEELMGMWDRCKASRTARKLSCRAIFKLATYGAAPQPPATRHPPPVPRFSALRVCRHP